MKKILKLFVLVAFLTPTIAFANNEYISKNLEETFVEEAEISANSESPFTYDLTNYKESDDQITIYLFRGKGCAYCNRFLTFLNSIIPEYGKFFKLESYEVWYDAKNAELFENVANFLDESAGGVPYIIIGDQVFPGYAPQYDEGIKKAILDLYNSDDRYDVFKEIKKAETKEKVLSILPYAIIVLVGGGLFTYTYLSNKKLNAKITELKGNLKLNEELIEFQQIQINELNEKLENNKKMPKETKSEKNNETKKVEKNTNKKNNKNKKKNDEK